MHRQRRPCLALDKKAIPARTYQPRLEEIETRLLPGETVGLGLLASFSPFGDLLPASVGRDEKGATPTGLV